MKHNLRTMAFTAAAALMLTGSASAISFTGTVAAGNTLEIYAPIGGTVESVQASVGQKVTSGDVLANLRTTKIYASEDGVITGIFAQSGDNAENISERYGAVMYIEGDTLYTISASTENAYNAATNKLVHVGEEVYLYCYSHGTHTGTGVITSIEGTDYNVNVISGEFLVGETVSIFRGESTASADRIGRGELMRKSPTAVTGNGSIVSIAVNNGDTVQRGDLLFETLDGSFDGLYMTGSNIASSADGVIAQLNLKQGEKIEKDGVAAILYPDGAMRVEAQISEYDLSELAVGDTVNVELNWNQDDEVNYPGTISMISAIADESAGENSEINSGVTYTVYVDFTPDENTRYGMSAVVSTLDEIEADDEYAAE